MEKEWIRYSPEGRDIKYDTKMHLRNMVSAQSVLGQVPLRITKMDNYGDDTYTLVLDEESIQVIARETGQTNYSDKIKEKEGVFFLTERSRKSHVEEALIGVFR
ncbi:hypothetical protein ACFL0X_00855 [Nanoarchaeota archaeon]